MKINKKNYCQSYMDHFKDTNDSFGGYYENINIKNKEEKKKYTWDLMEQNIKLLANGI